MITNVRRGLFAVALLTAVAACDDDMGPEEQMTLDPATATRAAIDRFSDAAGNLFQRSANAELPAAGAAVDFDEAPFITQGLGPDGRVVRYYNFDVMPTSPAPIWVLFYEGESTPVPGQLNIIDHIPGDAGYSDFWQVMKVTVPSNYVANTLGSIEGILAAGYTIEATDTIVNCPVVPEGSTASEGPGADGLTQGWYKDQAVFYFDFNEAAITAAGDGSVPTSPIYVTFNINPDQEGGGPGSGFMVEDGTSQTHNVVATVPGDAAYSPLWGVHPYDNQFFDQVSDLATATAIENFGHVANVNCPIVFTQ